MVLRNGHRITILILSICYHAGTAPTIILIVHTDNDGRTTEKNFIITCIGNDGGRDHQFIIIIIINSCSSCTWIYEGGLGQTTIGFIVNGGVFTIGIGLVSILCGGRVLMSMA
ncbi:unnamed protein product [Rotaria sordida]|uniref:Uncharacterized protein n=1 Tax=Rotaria sordida TaxID=392033 RepID=A0A815YGR4_9BILA|nr:unnamed protein product [Rotaria sordida]CAF1398790.1 unnamed protein product [Rotaria sordida]CAF1569569.1 unnamed protein product [Rotaria sordida]CAF4110822.1 unnamed protein product [Rotaria sordida]